MTVVKRVVAAADENVQPIQRPREPRQARGGGGPPAESSPCPPSVPGLSRSWLSAPRTNDLEPVGSARYGCRAPTMAAPRSSAGYHFAPLYARCSMICPAPRVKTSSRFGLHDATLGPALNEPPRSSQSLHRGPSWTGVDGVTTVGFLEGLRAGGTAVALAPGRAIKNRPVPATISTTLPKITGRDHRCWVLIMWGSTATHTIPKRSTCQWPSRYQRDRKMITR